MKCTFLKPDKTTCEANALRNSSFCFMHDPEKEEVRYLAITKGGLAPKKFLLDNNEEIILQTATDAKAFLGKVINGVWKGEIPATPVANTLGFLIRCFLDSNEQSEIEQRLIEIEKVIERRNNEQ